MSRTGLEPGDRLQTSMRGRTGSGHAPGSALIGAAAWLLALIGGAALYVSFSAQYAYILAVRHQETASAIEALLLDLGMIVFSLLALGLARAGQPARAERALILLCAAASSYMNVSAADLASPRSVAAYAVAPVALAVVVDRVVAVVRRHVLAEQQPSAWATAGRAAAAAARTGGLVLLYGLRFALAAPETARACAGWCRTPRPCQHSPKRPRPDRPHFLVPRNPSCSPCTALTRTTGTAAAPAGSPPSWPRRRGCSRAPAAATCTPNWTAGNHDHRSAR